MYDTIVFDLGNVLLDFPWNDYLKSLEADEQICRLIDKKLTQPMWRQFDLGIKSTEELLEMFGNAIPEHKELVKYYVANVAECIRPFDYADDWLYEMRKKGFRLYYLSNWSKLWFDIAKKNHAMDILDMFDGGIFSYKVHLAKPDFNIYKLLVDKYDLDVRRTIYIDDLQTNVDTANEIGMKGMLFKGYDKTHTELINL